MVSYIDLNMVKKKKKKDSSITCGYYGLNKNTKVNYVFHYIKQTLGRSHTLHQWVWLCSYKKASLSLWSPVSLCISPQSVWFPLDSSSWCPSRPVSVITAARESETEGILWLANLNMFTRKSILVSSPVAVPTQPSSGLHTPLHPRHHHTHSHRDLPHLQHHFHWNAQTNNI